MANVSSNTTRSREAVTMAIGDSGKPEPVNSDKVVKVGVLPTGPRNVATAASIRLIFWRRPGNEARPIRVRSILRPGTRRNHGQFPCVKFITTDFTRYTLDSGPVLGNEMSVALVSPCCASDPFWDSLSVRDRARINAAARRTA